METKKPDLYKEPSQLKESDLLMDEIFNAGARPSSATLATAVNAHIDNLGDIIYGARKALWNVRKELKKKKPSSDIAMSLTRDVNVQINRLWPFYTTLVKDIAGIQLEFSADEDEEEEAPAATAPSAGPAFEPSFDLVDFDGPAPAPKIDDEVSLKITLADEPDEKPPTKKKGMKMK